MALQRRHSRPRRDDGKVKASNIGKGGRQKDELKKESKPHATRASRREAKPADAPPLTEDKPPAVKPPADPWDGLGWLRLLKDWEADWESPGGLDFESFWSRFVLSIVPDGWIKPGYGPNAGKLKRQDVGAGHMAFFEMFAAGAFDALPAGQSVNFSSFLAGVVTAICRRDTRFFPDFGQAFKMMCDCGADSRSLLKARKRRHEFMVLAAMLDDSMPAYTVSGLKRKINRRFSDDPLTDKEVDKVMVRLGIAKHRRQR